MNTAVPILLEPPDGVSGMYHLVPGNAYILAVPSAKDCREVANSLAGLQKPLMARGISLIVVSDELIKTFELIENIEEDAADVENIRSIRNSLIHLRNACLTATKDFDAAGAVLLSHTIRYLSFKIAGEPYKELP